MSELENDVNVTNSEEIAEAETPVETDISEQSEPIESAEEALPAVESDSEVVAENAEENATDALKAAREQAGEKDVVYVGGSMYVLAELLAALGYDQPSD